MSEQTVLDAIAELALAVDAIRTRPVSIAGTARRSTERSSGPRPRGTRISRSASRTLTSTGRRQRFTLTRASNPCIAVSKRYRMKASRGSGL